MTTPVSAGQQQAAPPAPAATSLMDRETLTGDWFGAGPTWRENGVSLTASLTQFYQGLMSGDGSHNWDYGGKLDAFLRLDASKLGLWNGFGVSAHFELNYGHANQAAAGTFLPNNVALMFPGSNDTLADLSLSVSQQIGKRAMLMFGKINMVDMSDLSHDFSGGRGVEQFQHLEFTAPLSVIVPPMIFGGIISVQTDPAKFTLTIYDPTNQTQTRLEDPFEQGRRLSGLCSRR